MSELLVLIFLTVALVLLVYLLVLICQNLYDIFEEPKIQKRMKLLTKNKQPSVTVLVYARSSAATIGDCLESFAKNKYENFDIVVVNDRSKDTTAKIVKQFIKNHPKIAMKLSNSYKFKNDNKTLQAAYKKSKRGEVVISLRATTIVPNNFIKRAVATKFHNDYAKLYVDEPAAMNTLTEIIKTLNNLVWQRSKQVMVSDAKNIMPVKLEVNPEIIGSIVFILILSVSIITNEIIILWFCWLIVTAYIFSLIWLKQQRVTEKMLLTFTAISALFLLPISSALQGYLKLRSRN